MTKEEQQEYKGYKNYVVMNYLGIPTSPSSIRARLEAWREETKTRFWDQEKIDNAKEEKRNRH